MKSYTALTKNFFRSLARGEPVVYLGFEVVATDEKIIVRGPGREGQDVEFHYRRKPGEFYGFSKDQLAAILASHEKPLYTIRLRAAR